MLIYSLLGIALFIAVLLGIRAWLGYRGLSADARADYCYRREQNMSGVDAPEAVYVKVYRRVNAPRGIAHAAATFFANAVLTIPLLGLLNFILEYAWRFGGQSRVYEPGYLVWDFLLCAGLIGGWALISYAVMSRYYRNMPGTMDQELAREGAHGESAELR